MGQLAWAEYGGSLDSDQATMTTMTTMTMTIRTASEMNWGKEFDVPRFTLTLLLPGGTNSRRVHALTGKPDEVGDFPVFFTDIDDMPTLGVTWLARGFAGQTMIGGRPWSAGAVSGPAFRPSARGAWDTWTDDDSRVEKEARKTPR